MLATRLLKKQMGNNHEGLEKVVDFLCSESGSHDYTINRREAKEELGLCVDKPSVDQYRIIKCLYDDFSRELGFGTVFNPIGIQGAFSIRRGFIESIQGGSDFFVSEGRGRTTTLPNGSRVNSIEKTFEGWRHQDNYKKGAIRIGDKDDVVEGGVIYEQDDSFSI